MADIAYTAAPRAPVTPARTASLYDPAKFLAARTWGTRSSTTPSTTTPSNKWTRPYRPQTNGKVERFNRTLQEEWAYARPYLSESERVAAFPEFLHNYNHERGHTALRGNSPADRVPNLAGQYV